MSIHQCYIKATYHWHLPLAFFFFVFQSSLITTVISATLQSQKNPRVIQSNRHFCCLLVTCTSVLATYPSSIVKGAHLDSSSSHPALSGWLKRDGGVLLGAGMLGIPRAPRSLQASQAEQATAVLQTSPPSFIYFCWNIDACYERFKIMCLLFFLRPSTLFLMHK